MAGPASNFDGEIKKAMKPQSVATAKTPDKEQPNNAKSSTNAAPSQGRPPAAGNKQNEWNQPSGPVAQSGASGGINGDTHARMIAAGQAHMQAIHDHISAISSGKGAGGDSPVNQGTSAQ